MADANGRRVLWTADGPINLDGDKTRDRVELKPSLFEWIRQFADFAEYYDLGLHCARCQKDLIAKNTDSDRVWSAVCECREFVGQNRDWRPSGSVPVH